MVFVPRSFEQILIDMINHVRINTGLTDFSVGSIIRTILEAAALEDDEQYYQMVQLLDAFRIATSTGTDLDERAADLNMQRLAPKEAFVKLKIRNGSLTFNELAYNRVATATTSELDDTSEFPVTGYNYTIRIGEGTAQVEDVLVSNNDTATNTLTHGALVNDHSAHERVSVVSGSDISIPRSSQAEVPASVTNLAIKFSTVEDGNIIAGNYESGLINALAMEPGKAGNTSANTIVQFVATPPFTGASVTNPSSSSGGRDREPDTDFRDRLLRRFDELSRGTPLALESGVIGVEDIRTGKRVVTSRLREDWITHNHKLFVDDGSGLVPEYTLLARTAFAGAATAGVTSSLPVDAVSSFPSGGFLLLSPDVPTRAELVEYTSKNTGATKYLILKSPTTVVNNHLIGEEVILVDVVGIAETGQNFFNLNNFPVVPNSYEIYDNVSSLYRLKTEGTDYFLNRTSGEIQYYGAGLPSGTVVLSNHAYYTGLIQLVQKVVNGDPDDPETFPGLAAGGIIIYVDIPTIRTISVLLAVTVNTDFDKDDVREEVRRVVANYIDAQNIGGNIILARIIERAMSVNGVDNAKIIEPDGDQIILEDELPASYDSSGISRVTVL